LFAIDEREQVLQRQVGVGAPLHQLSNDTPRKQIDNDSKIQEALVGADVSDVGNPKLIRGLDIKLPVQGIVSHNGRTAAITAGLLFITNLGSYAR
jgi:hypothetical protein